MHTEVIKRYGGKFQWYTLIEPTKKTRTVKKSDAPAKTNREKRTTPKAQCCKNQTVMSKTYIQVPNIEKLWVSTRENEKHILHVNKLLHLLDEEVWDTGTPNQILNGEREDNENHVQRVRDANTDYPLLCLDEHGVYDIIDGFHRLAKILYILREPDVTVVFISPEQYKDALETHTLLEPEKEPSSCFMQ